MNPSNERLLHKITDEFPAQVKGMDKYREILPPISEQQLFDMCEGDPGMIELYDEMIEYFYRYTRDVCEQEALKHEGIVENNEEIIRRDGPRTLLHNTMIESVKIFARNLQKRGKDTSWLAAIDKKGRIGYASLALLITLAGIPREEPVAQPE